MNQALYAHMNNKKKDKRKIKSYNSMWKDMFQSVAWVKKGHRKMFLFLDILYSSTNGQNPSAH
jgi:hypothetical protein